MSGTAAAPSTTTWKLDQGHTTIGFAAKHMMFTTVRGQFTKFEGTIQADQANPANSTIEVTIDAASLNTNSEQRDGHLRSPDFLDVANYPQITFKGTEVTSPDGKQLTITGDLTIRDTTRPVTLKGHFHGTGKSPWGTEVAHFTADTKISRKDFGLTWNVGLEAGGVLVGDEVTITIEAEAIKQ